MEEEKGLDESHKWEHLRKNKCWQAHADLWLPKYNAMKHATETHTYTAKFDAIGFRKVVFIVYTLCWIAVIISTKLCIVKLLFIGVN